MGAKFTSLWLPGDVMERASSGGWGPFREALLICTQCSSFLLRTNHPPLLLFFPLLLSAFLLLFLSLLSPLSSPSSSPFAFYSSPFPDLYRPPHSSLLSLLLLLPCVSLPSRQATLADFQVEGAEKLSLLDCVFFSTFFLEHLDVGS